MALATWSFRVFDLSNQRKWDTPCAFVFENPKEAMVFFLEFGSLDCLKLLYISL